MWAETNVNAEESETAITAAAVVIQLMWTMVVMGWGQGCSDEMDMGARQVFTVYNRRGGAGWALCVLLFFLLFEGKRCEVWKKESINHLGALLFSPFSPHSLFTEYSKPYFSAATVIFLSHNASYAVQEPRTKKSRGSFIIRQAKTV